MTTDETIDEAWLLSIGFRRCPDDTELRLPFRNSPLGDDQYIVFERTSASLFALSRMCDIYEESETPPDRVYLQFDKRGDLLDLLRLLLARMN